MGPERGGKSDFACTVADVSAPLHYLALDYNYQGAVRRHRRLGADIKAYEFFYQLPFAPPTSPKEKGFQEKVNAIAGAVRPVYTAFKEELWRVLSPKVLGSVVIDNMTTLHYLCRLACFGYTHKVPMYLYAKRTNEMATILNQIRYSGKDVVTIHRWAEVWGNDDKPTGEFKRAAAFKPVAYEVMASLVAQKDDESGKFQVEVLDSTYNDDCTGMVFRGKKRTFAEVAKALRA